MSNIQILAIFWLQSHIPSFLPRVSYTSAISTAALPLTQNGMNDPPPPSLAFGHRISLENQKLTPVRLESSTPGSLVRHFIYSGIEPVDVPYK